MATVYTGGLAGNKRTYSRTYGNFRGLYAAGEESTPALNEFTYLENMYCDYDNPTGASVETIPGYRLLHRFNAPIYGFFRFPIDGRTWLVVHAGKRLFRFPADMQDPETEVVPVLSLLEEQKSTAFLFGEQFYILDGKNYYSISKTGVVNSVLNHPYCPITYYNGKAYEPRNILYEKAIERHVLNTPESYVNESPGLRYAINADQATCTVIGCNYTDLSVLVIPGKTMIADRVYEVTAIAPDAFTFHTMTYLHLSEGLQTIGARAFEGCDNLRFVLLPDSLTEIGEAAFAYSDNLEYVHLGGGLTTVAVYAFGACAKLTAFTYPLSKTSFNGISSPRYLSSNPANLAYFDEMGYVTVDSQPLRKEKGCSLKIPLTERFSTYEQVELDGRNVYETVTPLFPKEAYNFIPVSDIREAIANNTPFSYVVMTSYSDGSFSCTGTADVGGEFLLSRMTLSAGNYFLKGTPKNSSKYSLRLTYAAASREMVFDDYGDGCRFTLTKDTEVSLYFAIAEDTTFYKTGIYPSLSLSAGDISFHPSRKYDGASLLDSLYLVSTNREVLPLLTLDVRGKLYREYTYTEESENMYASSAVASCRMSALYDGRVFLTGNPALPNTVFYSGRTRDGKDDVSYFPEGNFFRDGSGVLENKAMFATPAGLCVIKAGDGEESRVFFHLGEDTGDDLYPRIYPAVSGSANAAATGGGLSFCGEPVYISENGLYSVSRASVAGEREPHCRSAKINRFLLQKDFSRFSMTLWKSYLVLSTGDGEVFLADAEKQDGEAYVFYRLTGIGSYTDDKEIFYFASKLPLSAVGLSISPKAGQETDLPIRTWLGYPCVFEKGLYYLCTTRGERRGGVFSPAKFFLSANDLLYFVTESGDLLLFNTDMRKEDRRLPAEAYSFMGHTYRSGFSLKSDDCGVPYLAKDTVRHSAVLQLSGFSGGALHILARTEKTPYTEIDTLYGGEADFGEIDFTNFHFGNDRHNIFPFKERLRRYAEKQYYIYTEDYRCRFGLTELSFRYTIGGRIKR